MSRVDKMFEEEEFTVEYFNDRIVYTREVFRDYEEITFSLTDKGIVLYQFGDRVVGINNTMWKIIAEKRKELGWDDE